MIGSTGILYFDMSLPCDLFKTIQVTFSQEDKIVLTKTTKDLELEEHRVNVYLTEEESFLFDHRVVVKGQIRAVTHKGDVIPQKVRYFHFDECLDKGVMLGEKE